MKWVLACNLWLNLGLGRGSVNGFHAGRNFAFGIGKARYIGVVNFLTKQEQMALCLLLVLLLTGWVVKSYRLAHPPAAAAVVLPKN